MMTKFHQFQTNVEADIPSAASHEKLHDSRYELNTKLQVIILRHKEFLVDFTASYLLTFFSDSIADACPNFSRLAAVAEVG